MRLRHLFMLAAGVLALPVALAVMVQLFAWLAGFSWIFLFGDEPWPDSAQGYLIAVPVVAGLVTLIAGAALGYGHGRRREAASRPDRARRHAYGLMLAGIGVWLAAGFIAISYGDRQEVERAQAAEREAAFARFRAARHVITAATPEDGSSDGVQVTLSLSGSRAGPYRLTWRLVDPTYDVGLLDGERRLELDARDASLMLVLERADVARRYRKAVLGGRDDRVLVDGAFRLYLTLEPELEAEERRALPAREIENVARGFSQLRFETRVDVPMALDLTRD